MFSNSLIQAKRDGDVVDIDGVSTLSLNVPTNNYYVVINHRNHLGIMSATPLSLSSIPTIVDCTSNTANIYGGSNAVKEVNGTFTMIGGDYDINGQIQNTDLAAIIQNLGGAGYSKADLDMNEQIQNTDINIIMNPNIGKGQQF